jgi:hypothetical protein
MAHCATEEEQDEQNPTNEEQDVHFASLECGRNVPTIDASTLRPDAITVDRSSYVSVADPATYQH